jgi:2Fe-2S ferredoxin
MPKVNFLLPDGTEQALDVPVGWSLMEAARRDGIGGIVAECGGGAICGTCHVHIQTEWLDKLEPAGFTEAALLEIVPDPSDTSRLACQIIMKEELADMCVRVPAEQLAL